MIKSKTKISTVSQTKKMQNSLIVLWSIHMVECPPLAVLRFIVFRFLISLMQKHLRAFFVHGFATLIILSLWFLFATLIILSLYVFFDFYQKSKNVLWGILKRLKKSIWGLFDLIILNSISTKCTTILLTFVLLL